jgi:hypothetical protein
MIVIDNEESDMISNTHLDHGHAGHDKTYIKLYSLYPGITRDKVS